jgi:hypothetical protein
MRIKNYGKKVVSLTVFMLGMAFAACSYAYFSQIDFNLPGGGAISFDGSMLTASGIPVNNITGVNAPSNSGNDFLTNKLPGTSTTLSLSDPAYLGSNGRTGWYFGAGAIEVANSSGSDPVLLLGNYSSLSITQTSVLNGMIQFNLLFTDFSDTKDPNIVSYFGFSPNVQWVGSVNFVFDSSYLTPGSTFTGLVPGSGDIDNVAAMAPSGEQAPIPGAVWLFGPGLVGVIALKRKCTRGNPAFKNTPPAGPVCG